ncbi:cytochrome c-type biogenesis protein CcmH [Maricaulaceae bacterium NA33B04]|nr:cytochrome c-type biogenesis protein CcmH [Maricaulaceae bacterium NA33B04]
MKALVLALALSVQQVPATELPPAEEARAQELMREIKCMVCSGESILDSNAPMALDMRRFVREQVALGQDDDALRQALVDRFGYEVLLRPPLDGRTIILWLTPFLLVAFGGALLLNSMKRKRVKA